MVPWESIETVLLDMDGTLLDLHFDTHFWLEHVPVRYAERHGVPINKAREDLHGRYRAMAGTMQWYSVDYWSAQLDLDIALLKEEVDHLIAVHPHVPAFLAAVRASGRRSVLVTNAHSKSLALKMERTQLAGDFDRIICAHDLGIPKEHAEFWSRFQSVVPFANESTLLVDDSLSVLQSAKEYGIAYLLCVRNPDSTLPTREIAEFEAIESFRDLMPGLV
ncbi:GMP/IMP nucleotidase [Sedimenticola sp.]|uniref:GMP/IMP nucleotidase n=1 Tax=Sedimenticola sp. TaxID=1940285 RepID=UPI003D0B640B